MVESNYLTPAPQFRLKVVHKNGSVVTIVQCLFVLYETHSLYGLLADI